MSYRNFTNSLKLFINRLFNILIGLNKYIVTLIKKYSIFAIYNNKKNNTLSMKICLNITAIKTRTNWSVRIGDEINEALNKRVRC